MKKTDYFSIEFKNDKLVYLDQTKLPLVEDYIETDDYERIAVAIERLELRGAPLIGIAAAYALALALKNVPSENQEEVFEKAYQRLFRTRPTAVNLFYALNEIKKVFKQRGASANVYPSLLSKAIQIHQEDSDKCRRIGENGLNLFRHKSNIITHCNTGKLATGGDGTAFNVIKTGFDRGLVNFVYADETRPLLQGSRLTAFELEKSGIPFELITDSSSAVLMKNKRIDFAVTGADRIAFNGDTANKIGTYSLAVLCYHHDIPFYVAAPSTTIDRTITSGEDIIIEMRDKKELFEINGNRVVPDKFNAFTPAFDITPSYLIRGIITEDIVYTFPYNFLI
jgi:methylthioribose-1-phosphate isomerase